jgi:hypothetical protein
MITKKILKIEDVFRQIAEEKPYLVFPFNVTKFHSEAERITNKKISLRHAQAWLSGYRKRKGFQ